MYIIDAIKMLKSATRHGSQAVHIVVCVISVIICIWHDKELNAKEQSELQAGYGLLVQMICFEYKVLSF